MHGKNAENWTYIYIHTHYCTQPAYQTRNGGLKIFSVVFKPQWLWIHAEGEPGTQWTGIFPFLHWLKLTYLDLHQIFSNRP